MSTPRAVTSSRVRWVICAFLFFVTANNYFDRQIFGVLGPSLMERMGWKPSVYADMVTWFDIAYAVGFLLSGRLLDWVGTRLGFALAVAAWSLAAMAHAGLSTILGFKIARAALGLAEAGHLPGAIKVVGEWFPKQERALATGLYKAGGDLGAIIVPILIPWMYVSAGWRWTFVFTGASGIVWLLFWIPYYRAPEKHPKVAADELLLIRDGRAATAAVLPPMPWSRLLRLKQTYGYILAKFLTDAIWHWYLYLLPLFLALHFHLSIKQFGLPLVVVYACADIGSIGGGWLSSALMKRGWAVTPARKLAMAVCCIAVMPAVFIPHVSSVWLAVPLVGLAMAAHQGWTSNLFTTVSDLFPGRTVGSVVGIGGTAGMIGAALLAAFTGHLLETTSDYTLIFIIAGSAYLVAWTLFHLLTPSLESLDPRVPAATS